MVVYVCLQTESRATERVRESGCQRMVAEGGGDFAIGEFQLKSFSTKFQLTREPRGNDDRLPI